MHLVTEILNPHAAPRKYLAGASEGIAYITTRLYAIDFHGSEQSVQDFVRKVLFDAIAEKMAFSEQGLMEGFQYFLEVAQKPALLDYERDVIWRYWRETRSSWDFELEKLTLARRYYFLASEKYLRPDQFMTGWVNPVIHQWKVVSAS